MGVLLDALLEVSRITVGMLALNKDRVAVRGEVDAAVEVARPVLDQRRHTLNVCGDALDMSLDADALRLTQALGNLLDNAARYTAPGGTITVSANSLPGQVELAVHDTGTGMAADDLERVFDKFSPLQGRSTAAPRHAVAAPAASASNSPWDDAGSGLGVGLALAKGLVELHGGSVSASSPGAGARQRVPRRVARGRVDHQALARHCPAARGHGPPCHAGQRLRPSSGQAAQPRPGAAVAGRSRFAPRDAERAFAGCPGCRTK